WRVGGVASRAEVRCPSSISFALVVEQTPKRGVSQGGSWNRSALGDLPDERLRTTTTNGRARGGGGSGEPQPQAILPLLFSPSFSELSSPSRFRGGQHVVDAQHGPGQELREAGPVE